MSARADSSSSGTDWTASLGVKASTYIGASGIMWASLVELGIGALLKAMAIGFVEVVLTASDVQVDLLVGLGEFLAALVRVWTEGPTAAIRAAWSGSAFEVFGVFAPLVVLVELVVVLWVAVWAVRNR